MKRFFLATSSTLLAITAYCFVRSRLPETAEKPAYFISEAGRWETLFSEQFDADFTTVPYFDPLRVTTEDGTTQTLYATKDRHHPYYLR